MSREKRVLREFIQSLTVEQMEGLQKILDPQQYMPLLIMMEESLKPEGSRQRPFTGPEFPPWARRP